MAVLSPSLASDTGNNPDGTDPPRPPHTCSHWVCTGTIKRREGGNRGDQDRGDRGRECERKLRRERRKNEEIKGKEKEQTRE